MTLAASALRALLSLGLAAALAAPMSQNALLRDDLWRSFNALPNTERPKLGLVLSAGSLRATTHVGVIYALENAGFRFDVVTGTSMGAVLGSLYAGGLPISKIWQEALKLHVGSGSNLDALSLIRLLLADKLLSSAPTERFIHEQLGDKRFEDLPRRFACVAMDLYTGEAIVFREGDVGLAVRASMNLPGVFQPVEYRHRYLVDGGVVDYIPVDAARLLKADWVLASVAEADYTHARPTSVLQSLEQVIDIRGSLLSREQRKQANFVIEPPVGDIGSMEANRIPEAIRKGVIAATRAAPKAQENLILFSMKELMRGWLPEAQ
ncbi:MAG: patatin-like phospholipase family protein [Elusimicrobia bacterium]|nr:patatin-like phospholipase family protein [Elusimicrobiota bacterium]MDE2425352.1 patatin-like phospholipase family protein [Elusimicrobiota bacterium]